MATIVVQWNSAALQAIRNTHLGPPMTARALAIVHTCIYDAWAAYTPEAIGTRLGSFLRQPIAEHTLDNKNEAISYAAYRALVDLYPSEATLFDTLMASLGYDPTDLSTDLRTPRGVGNRGAQAVLAFRHGDGSNQASDLHPGAYSDYTGYRPVDDPDHITDPKRWQPLRVSDGHGGFVIQQYIAPHWGLVTPFALASGAQFRPAIGPAKYPSREYHAQAEQILQYSAQLDDEQKVIAEYWADGPSSEQPPGHWCLFAQFVSQRDNHDLDADVKLYFILANALFDASIACWDAKRAFDSVRPVTAIHALFAGNQVRAWAGPGQGTKNINGEDWQPYQPVTIVTPPFPEYFSGRSTFSAAATEILKRFTGSDRFGASYTQAPGTSRVESGVTPTSAVTLSWATFTEAADQAGPSRRYGGIHFEDGDLMGRMLGRSIAAQAWDKAQSYITGKENTMTNSAYLAASQSRRSLYAPYWYIDDLTDSIIEVKSNLASPLSLIPLLTPMNGPAVQLNVITVAPFATVRLALKSQPQLDHLQRSSGKGTSHQRWGDGSRPNSLIGGAQLVPISPTDASARAFGAWILTEDPKERLGMVTTFEFPSDLTNPTTQEGLWWLPFPGTKAYFSLQNTSPFPLELQVDLISDGGKIVTKYLPLEVAASYHFEIGEILGMATPPSMGGIRVSTLCGSGQAGRSLVVGRGRLIQENLGFASSLMLHESLGEIPTIRGSELHAPAAYFGQLDRLISHSRAVLHPHLLMRNTTNHEITMEAINYGRDTGGKPTKFPLKPMTLEPQSVTHVDLQEQRQASQSTLADGIAGLRLMHSGSPTDVAVELINIEEKGRFAYYDSVKSHSLHRFKMQAAVSFNLASGHHSFLILKNTTNAAQNVRVLLDFDDGKRQYDVDLPEIPAQQVNIIDIKRLRDAGIPDKNGQRLPPEVEFGGAAIFSEPGAFVFSDPTFIFAEPVTSRITASADIVASDPPGDNGPNGNGPTDTLFFAPSCGRGGDRTPPPSTPPTSIKTVKIWVNAFIPGDVPDQTFPAPGIFTGKTMVKPGCVPGNFCYLTDQRSFDSYIHASSRMHSEIVVDVATVIKLSEWHHCDCTQELECTVGTPTCARESDTSRMSFTPPTGNQNGIIQVDLNAAARDECVAITRLLGDIRYLGRFIINVPARTVEFIGSISVFPAFEAYATADDGAGNTLFRTGPFPGASPCNLPFSDVIPQEGFTRI
jgi:hypothetical protein